MAREALLTALVGVDDRVVDRGGVFCSSQKAGSALKSKLIRA